MTYAMALFTLLLAAQARAGEVSDNYSKHYQDYYKEAKKAGFDTDAVSKLSTQHLGAVEKNTAEVAKRGFNAASKNAYKNLKAAPLPKGGGEGGGKSGAAATNSPVAAKPKARSGAGPTTGDMSAGASKGAEKVQFGTPKN
jgi:hypothetical protein